MGPVLSSSPVTPAAAGQAFERYLEWACGVEWADVCVTARRRAVLVLADDLAAAFSAVDEPQVAAVFGRTCAAATGEQASLLAPGRPRAGVLQAAMSNGLAMGWNELDEGYRKAVCHAGLYVLPALLACAETENAPLRELLRALLLGYETVTRIARSFGFASMRIHPHALLSPVGAAAGVGFLRRLPPGELLSAISGAATLGMAGPFNHALQGVLARNTWAAQGACSGLAALEWAHCGIGGQASSLHDVYVSALGASHIDLSPLEPGAADGWAVDSGYHKMNASCQYTHSAIEAVQMLLEQDPTLSGGESLVDIEVQAHPLGFALQDTHPATTLGAKFSVPHAVAAAFVHGNGGVASFNAASLGDPRIARLRDITRMTPFPEVRAAPHDRPSRVIVTDRDGLRAEAVCWSAQGGPDRPFPEDALWSKLRVLSTPHAPGLVRTMRAMAMAAQSPGDAPALAHPWREYVGELFLDDSAIAGASFHG